LARLKIERMVMKKLTITGSNISQKQWSNLVLELNLIKKAWKPYADIEIQGTGIKKIIAFGTRVGGEDAKENR